MVSTSAPTSAAFSRFTVTLISGLFSLSRVSTLASCGSFSASARMRLDHLVELGILALGLERDPDRARAGVLPERGRIVRVGEHARQLLQLRRQRRDDLLLLALALVPWRQPREGDALRDDRIAGNHEERLRLGNFREDLLDALGVFLHEIDRCAFRPDEEADDRAAILDRRQFGLQRLEDEIAAGGKQPVRPAAQAGGRSSVRAQRRAIAVGQTDEQPARPG